jgi:hypothetical protein
MDKDTTYRNHRPYGAALMRQILRENAQVKCLSSHATVPTLTLDSDHHVLPVAFVRHPLLRSASVYRFNKKSADPDQPFAADFTEWLSEAMDANRLEACNYQSRMLSLRSDGHIDDDPTSPIRQAHWAPLIDRLDQFPVVGVVEAFAQSAAALNALIRPYFPEFTLTSAANQTKVVPDWEKEVAQIQDSLPPEVMSRFYRLNRQDYDLHQHFLGKILQPLG